MSTCRGMQIDPYPLPCIKLKFKYTKVFNVKPDSLKLIEQKVGNSLKLIGTGDNFLNRTPVAQALRSTIDKWDLMKLKSFCKAKSTVIKIKWQPTDCYRLFTNLTSNRGLISKIYKDFKKLDTNNPNNAI